MLMPEGLSVWRPGMSCVEFQARLHPYVDGELSVDEMLAAHAHAAGCRPCANLAGCERQFRELLRGQPRNAAPADLRARLPLRLRGDAWWAVRRSWHMPAIAAVAAPIIVAALLAPTRDESSLLAELIEKHSAYAQIEQPAELVSSSGRDIV